MNAVLVLAWKDLRLLLRDRGAFLVTFVFPLVYCVFFGLIFQSRSGDAGPMKIAVVDEDQSPASRDFIDKLRRGEDFEVSQVSAEEAADLVRRGARLGYVEVPAGYGEAFERLFWGDPPRLVTGIDPSRGAEGMMFQGVLTKYAYEALATSVTDVGAMRRRIAHARAALGRDSSFDDALRMPFDVFFTALDRLLSAVDSTSEMADADSDVGREAANRAATTEASTAVAWEPIRFETREVVRARIGPRNSYEVSFPQGMIWGVLGCAAAFAVSLVNERTTGTLARLRTAPIGRFDILAGKAGACFLSTLAVGAIMFTVAILFFGVRPDSPVFLAISWTAVSLCFVGIMMFLSVLGNTERTVSGVTWAILLGMAMIGGGMIPLMFMPRWLHTLSHISPVRWSILSVEGAVWRGFTLVDMLLPWTVLLAIGAGCFALGLRAFRWMDRG